jgi:hypothetical protein
MTTPAVAGCDRSNAKMLNATMFQIAGKPTKQWSSDLLPASQKWYSDDSRMKAASRCPNGPTR